MKKNMINSVGYSVVTYRRFNNTAVQSQKAVSAYFASEQILPSQKAVSAHFTSKQILPFGFAWQNT